MIRGKIASTIADPDALNRELHQLRTIEVMRTQVGNGRPRYVLVRAPKGG